LAHVTRSFQAESVVRDVPLFLPCAIDPKTLFERETTLNHRDTEIAEKCGVFSWVSVSSRKPTSFVGVPIPCY